MTADHPPHPEARVLQLSNNEILTVNFCDWLVVTVANTIHAVINSFFYSIRVRTGPVPGSGPGRCKTGLVSDLFWTGAGPCVAILTA